VVLEFSRDLMLIAASLLPHFPRVFFPRFGNIIVLIVKFFEFATFSLQVYAFVLNSFKFHRLWA